MPFRISIMPVRIVQVTNNTNHTLHYHNNETGHNILISPKTEDGMIPTSDYHDDTVPFSDKNNIIVKLDDGLAVEISDHNGELRVVGPINGTGEREDTKFDTLEDGGQYVLRVDEGGEEKTCYFSLLEYGDEDEYTAGFSGSAMGRHSGKLPFKWL